MPQENSLLFTSITTEEFARKRIVSKEIAEVMFDNQTFIEGPTFSKDNRQIAIECCQQQAQNKRHTLLVSSQFFFTIWLQKLPLEESINSQNQESNWFINNLPATAKQASRAKNDLKVVYVNRENSELSYVDKVKEKVHNTDKLDTTVRKYRGVSYEVDKIESQLLVTHSSAEITAEEIGKNPKKKTVVQKYRGITYAVEKGQSKQLGKLSKNSITKSTRKYRGQSY